MKDGKGQHGIFDGAEGKKRRGDFLNFLKTGASIQGAAAAAGIGRRTIFDHLATGRRERDAGQETEDAKLLEEVELASAASEGVLAARLLAAASDPKNWGAALAVLERRHPDEWAMTTKVKLLVEQQLTQALNVLQQRLTPDEYGRVLQALADGGFGEAPALPPHGGEPSGRPPDLS